MPRKYLFCSIVLATAGLVAGIALSSRADEIHTAVQQGNLDQVKKILAQTPKAAAAPDKNTSNLTPLHYAVSGAQKPIFDELLKHKPDVNAKEANGYTPLHYAVMNYRIDMIDPLLAAGADITAADNAKQTP